MERAEDADSRLAMWENAGRILDSVHSHWKIRVLNTSEHYIAVYKPPSMWVQHDCWEVSRKNFQMVCYKFLQESGSFDGTLTAAHRLDVGTSGVFVWAKSQAAMRCFHDQMQDKRYLVLVRGRVPGEGYSDKPLDTVQVQQQAEPGKGGRSWRTAVVPSGGKPAMTRWRVVQSWQLTSGLQAGTWLTLLRVKIETGRTHQIRVHLEHEGFPVVGDPDYSKFGEADMHLVPRIFLHCYSMEFQDPSNKRFSAFCELSMDLQQALVDLLPVMPSKRLDPEFGSYLQARALSWKLQQEAQQQQPGPSSEEPERWAQEEQMEPDRPAQGEQVEPVQSSSASTPSRPAEGPSRAAPKRKPPPPPGPPPPHIRAPEEDHTASAWQVPSTDLWTDMSVMYDPNPKAQEPCCSPSSSRGHSAPPSDQEGTPSQCYSPSEMGPSLSLGASEGGSRRLPFPVLGAAEPCEAAQADAQGLPEPSEAFEPCSSAASWLGPSQEPPSCPAEPSPCSMGPEQVQQLLAYGEIQVIAPREFELQIRGESVVVRQGDQVAVVGLVPREDRPLREGGSWLVVKLTVQGEPFTHLVDMDGLLKFRAKHDFDTSSASSTASSVQLLQFKMGDAILAYPGSRNTGSLAGWADGRLERDPTVGGFFELSQTEPLLSVVTC